MNTELRELSIKDIEMIKSLFASVFTKEPCNDEYLFTDREEYACVWVLSKESF